jgi:hypothetical protein
MRIGNEKFELVFESAPVHQNGEVFDLLSLNFLEGVKFLLKAANSIALASEINKVSNQRLLVLNEMPMETWLLNDFNPIPTLVFVQDSVSNICLSNKDIMRFFISVFRWSRLMHF